VTRAPSIPAYGLAFLEWLRATSEAAWAELPEGPPGSLGSAWRRGTRWVEPLSEAEIDAAERRHGLRFPPDYRLFLRVLHTTAPERHGVAYRGDEQVATGQPGFWDWRRDAEAIDAASAGLLEGLVFDVEENGLWPASWGARPDDPAARGAQVAALFAAAPRLVPVIGHRFLLPVEPYPVLSVHQSDIVVYGGDLREFLLAELLPSAATEPGREVATAGVPFWGELIG
jgi:hypothetical protein